MNRYMGPTDGWRTGVKFSLFALAVAIVGGCGFETGAGEDVSDENLGSVEQKYLANWSDSFGSRSLGMTYQNSATVEQFFDLDGSGTTVFGCRGPVTQPCTTGFAV